MFQVHGLYFRVADCFLSRLSSLSLGFIAQELHCCTLANFSHFSEQIFRFRVKGLSSKEKGIYCCVPDPVF